MKKFISFIAAALIASVAAFSQTTVLGTKTFENVYVGVEGGVISPMQQNAGFWKDLRGMAGVEVGKNFTPVIGASVEALANFNTTGTWTIVDQSNVVINGKVNLSNWFGGYKGEPRRVEVSLVPGIGWGHNYGETYAFNDKNYITYNTFAQVDVNLGKARALQINVKPGAVWAAGSPNVAFDSRRGAAVVRVGVTYKFGSKRLKSHNFVTCPYTVTQEVYDALMAKYNEAVNKPAEKVVTEVPVEKVVEKTVVTNIPSDLIVTFDLGSTTLKAAEYAKLKAFVAKVDTTALYVVGSADSATGTEARNEYLSAKRADVVANALKDLGITNVTTSTTLDSNEVPEASRAAIITIAK